MKKSSSADPFIHEDDTRQSSRRANMQEKDRTRYRPTFPGQNVSSNLAYQDGVEETVQPTPDQTCYDYSKALEPSHASGSNEHAVRDWDNPHMREQFEEFLNTRQDADVAHVRDRLQFEGLTEGVVEQLLTVHTIRHMVLHWAVEKSSIDTVHVIKRCVSKTVWEDLVQTKHANGRAVLHEAVLSGCIDMVKLIVESVETNVIEGVLKIQDRKGRTCLHTACGHTEVIRYIMGSVSSDVKYAMLNLEDEYNCTAFQAASYSGQSDVVKLIIEIAHDIVQIDHKTDFSDSGWLEDLESVIDIVSGHITDILFEPLDDDGSINEYSNCEPMSDVEMVKAVVFERYVNQKDEQGLTHLHHACGCGHIDFVKFIMKTDGMLEKLLCVPDMNGCTALQWACVSGQTQIAIFIITKVDNIETILKLRDESGCSLLHEACKAGQTDVVECVMMNQLVGRDMLKTLLMLTDKFGGTALHAACANGQTHVVNTMISRIDSVLRNRLVFAKDAHGQTALHVACEQGYEDIVKCILGHLKHEEIPALISKPNEDNEHVIALTIRNQHYAVLGVLLSIPVTLPINLILDNITPEVTLHACQRGENDAVLSILEAVHNAYNGTQECLLDARDSDGRDILHLACNRGNKKLLIGIIRSVEKLPKDKRVEYMCRSDTHGKTALHECCEQGHTQLVQILLDVSAKWSCASKLLTRQDIAKKSALWYAFELGNYNTVNTLLDAATGADCVPAMIFCKDKSGQTLIHRSCRNQYEHISCLEKVLKVAQTQTKYGYLDMQLLCMKDGDEKTFLHYLSEAVGPVKHYLLTTITEWELHLFKQQFNHTPESVACSNPPMNACDVSKDADFKSLIDVSFCRWFLTNRDINNKTALHYAGEGDGTFLGYSMSKFYESARSDDQQNDPTSHPGSNSCNQPASDTNNPTPGASDSGEIDRSTQAFKRAYDQYIHTCVAKKKEENKNSITDKPLLLSKPSHFHLLHLNEPLTYYKSDSDSLLKAIGDSKCIELTGHPYVKAYLNVCWTNFVRCFVLLNIFLYMCQVLSLTAFITSHHYTSMRALGSEGEQIVLTGNNFTIVSQILLMFFSLFVTIIEGFQMIAKRSHYWRALENYTDLTVCISGFILSAASMIIPYNSWLHQLGTAVMCVAWINAAWMMTKVSFGTFRKISLMFVMFFRVIKKVCIFMPVFSVFILAMALSYNNLLQSQESFRHLGVSIMKTMAMTIGELDFASIFFPGNIAAVPPFYILTCLLFVVFLGIMNLSVMNLLIAIAVGDIAELDSQAEILAFQSRVDLIMESLAMLRVLNKIHNCITCQHISECQRVASKHRQTLPIDREDSTIELQNHMY